MTPTTAVTIARCYEDGRKCCPFFGWAEEGLALCGAPRTGWLMWSPADRTRVEPSPRCPLRNGPIHLALTLDPNLPPNPTPKDAP